MKRMEITIDDIAIELNISVSTVSRALNNNPRISDATKQRVLQTAKKLGYHPVVSDYGKKLASSGQVVALVCPHLNTPMYRMALERLQRELLPRGILVSAFFSGNSTLTEKLITEKLISLKPAMVVISTASDTLDYSHLQQLIDASIPLICFNRVNFDFQVPKIIADNYQGAFSTASRFISGGVSRIGLVIGNRRCPIGREILNGVKQAFLKNGMAWNSSYLVSCDLENSSISQAVDYFMSLPEPPEALIVDRPQSVLVVVQVLADRGLRVPEDMPVVGFGTFDYNRLMRPAISTIEVDANRMADELAQKVNEQLADEFNQIQSNTVIVPTELIVRETSFR